MNDTAKAYMKSCLVDIFNNSRSQRDVCLSVIAICMLDGTPTEEELTRRGSTYQNQSGEQGGQARSSE